MAEDYRVLSPAEGELLPLVREHSAHRVRAAAEQVAASIPRAHVAQVLTRDEASAPQAPAAPDHPRGTGDSMLKTIFATLIGTLIGVGLAVGGGVWYLTRGVGDGPSLADRQVEFPVTPDEVAGDLIGHTVATQGQVWLFTPDQKVSLKVLEKRATPTGVQVVVDLTAVVQFPAAPKAIEPIVPKSAETGKTGSVGSSATGAAAAAQPTKATITGTARLTYERAANKWFLVGADALNLRITAE